jgi:plastocyanin
MIMAATKISRDALGAIVRTRGRSALDAVMLIGLAVVVVGNVVAMAIEGDIIPPVLIATIAYLICAIVVATGWRWSMAFPLVLCSLGIVADFASGFPEYSLTHPSANYVAFVLFVLEYPLLVVVIVAAALKLAQTLHHETPHAPEWMRPALGAVIGLMLGAFLIGITAQSPSAGGAAAAKAGTQTVHLAAARFAPDIIALHKGDTLTIVDDAPVPHTLANGTWSADNKPVPGVEPGAPPIRNVELNNNTVTVGPFTTPGTYHIYCAIHPGMALTIIVQ